VAQKETGHLVDALESFRAFLRDPMDAASSQYKEPAEAGIRDLEARIAWVVVTLPSGPAQAAIKLDGLSMQEATLGVRRPIDPGRHKLEAQAEGYRPYVNEFEVAAAGNAQVTVTLELQGASPVATASAAAPDAGAPKAPSGSRRRTLGAGIAIGGTALLMGGVVVGLMGVSKAGNAETRDGKDADSARTLALVGDVVGGVGVVAIAVGGYLLLTKPSASAEQSKPAVHAACSPWVSSTGAGLALGGVF